MVEIHRTEVPTYPALLLSGIDSLYVSYYLDGLALDWDELSFQKEKLRQDPRSEFLSLRLGGEEWALSASGSYPYRYVLRNPYFTVKLAEANQPNCYVQYLSEGLWKKGEAWLNQRLENWFKKLGVQKTRVESVSRVDLAFDFHLPEMDFTAESFVTRAKKDAQWRDSGKVQTFVMGKGAIVVRVYDKVAEIEQQSQKYWFYDLWGQKAEVWRVEFQVRKDKLKAIGINRLEDLRAFKGDLLRELATQHTSLRLPTGDQNRSRWPYHPLWMALLEAIEHEPQTGLIATARGDISNVLTLERQLRSLYGDLKAVGSVLSLMQGKEEPIAFIRLLELLPSMLSRTHQDTVWRNDVGQRMKKRRLGQ
ncbi:MAG: hypothetical protein CMF31_05625 [Kordiimonas sp.]|nr:hypothetical protein [Kordiimonas sp.]